MARLSRALLLLGAALVAFGAARALDAALSHAPLRARWETARDAGDALASDRAYAASRDAHERAHGAGRLLGFGFLLLGLRARPRRVGLRVGLVLAGVLAAAALSLDDGESAVLRTLTAAAPGTAVGLFLAGLGGGFAPRGPPARARE
ncbi:MAG: hypothetical protein AAF447_19875 [Myxococcota bacterium]